MTPTNKKIIKNNYIYQGENKDLSNDGYKRDYTVNHYLFGIKIKEHRLHEFVKITTDEKNNLGF